MHLAASDFRAATKSLERSIVGIGYHDGPQHYIFGTGFVIREDGWILTNRHVLQPLLDHDGDGTTVIRPESRVMQFVERTNVPSGFFGIGLANARIMELRWIEQPNPAVPINVRDNVELDGQKADIVIPPESPDIGICRLDLDQLPPEALPLSPVRMVSSEGLEVGTPVGVLGFSHGLQGPLCANAANVQWCPLLQTGCISAILPHRNAPSPTGLFIDIHIYGGSSGSPLFDVNGDVVGVVFASRLQFEQLVERTQNGDERRSDSVGTYVRTPIGCAVPNAIFLDKIVQLLPGAIRP